jgi:4'-phosphopantetheinyl transferase
MKVFLFDAFNSLNANFIENNIKLMPAERQERCKRYRRTTDKTLCIACYLLLCHALKQLYNFTDKIEFGYNGYGKPHIKGNPEVFFNMSHTEGLAICALGDEELGVDCEKIIGHHEDVAKMIFSKKEYEAFIQSADKAEAFFRLWTLKESYVKAIGTDLALHLNSAEFDLHIRSGDYSMGDYSSKNFIYKNDYSVSLCKKGIQEKISAELMTVTL